jgi:hypothetical protein
MHATFHVYEHSAKLSKLPKLKNVFQTYCCVFVIVCQMLKKNTNQHVNKHAEIETSVELLSLPPEGTKKKYRVFSWTISSLNHVFFFQAT